MISRLLRRYRTWRNRREFERDRRGYLANLQASLDAKLIDSDTFDMKAEQWADR